MLLEESHSARELSAVAQHREHVERVDECESVAAEVIDIVARERQQLVVGESMQHVIVIRMIKHVDYTLLHACHILLPRASIILRPHALVQSSIQARVHIVEVISRPRGRLIAMMVALTEDICRKDALARVLLCCMQVFRALRARHLRTTHGNKHKQARGVQKAAMKCV